MNVSAHTDARLRPADAPARSEDLAGVADWIGHLAAEQNVPLGVLLEAMRPIMLATLERQARALSSLDELVRVLTPRIEELDPVPRAALNQARRRADLRADLLRQGAYTYRALAEGRSSSEAAVRQLVRRAKQRHELFSVEHDSETFLPAFLISESFAPVENYSGAIAALQAVGEDGWALWAWFCSPSSWLDGAVPAELGKLDPERVTEAACRRASNVA
jgi:hypothetical protein